MMEFAQLVLRLCFVEIRRPLLIVTTMVAIIIIFQGITFPYDQASSLLRAQREKPSFNVVHGNVTAISYRELTVRTNSRTDLEKYNHNGTNEVALEENEAMEESGMDDDMESEDEPEGTADLDKEYNLSNNFVIGGVRSTDGDPTRQSDGSTNFSAVEADTSMSRASSLNGINQNKSVYADKPETVPAAAKRILTVGRSALKRLNGPAMSISEMTSLFVQNSVTSIPMRRKKWSSARDRELISAKVEIDKAPVVNDAQGLQSFIYQNISRFIRSYDLMERVLKVYVYKEGEKPIFHKAKPRGIYASEGWFMKLMEGNKKFLVRDPKKAHLFYLPFSSRMLRSAIDDHKFKNHRDLEKHLKTYIDLISRKYRFWNITGGADHFLVACHDWATRITHQRITGNAIRSLCNSDAAKGFQVGKDTALPVTYVRSAEEPTRDLGGRPPSERPILAFFAGSMHGYLRPILLHYWENKEPDMKIVGSLPRDLNGKKTYREFMKSSKFCICARGYEVHTPRVVEAIFYECVPVIISDNYVPPFLEVLRWEEFALFVREKDVPNLGRILRSIPEEKYLRMHLAVKAVQRHFIWHKNPIKYDLFHMVLHSVWHNRISRLRPK